MNRPAPSCCDPVAIGYALARPMFDPDVALGATDPRVLHHATLPAETAAMARMVPARRHAFAAGRAAARLGMAQLGLAPKPIPMSADRAPVWPDGVVGSLSHSRTCCLAAVAHSRDVRSLGLDVEEDAALPADLLDTVCTPRDLEWIDRQTGIARGRLAKLIFSAKECAYKCQYPLSRTLFGFDALDLAPDLDSGRFRATYTRNVAPFAAGDVLTGSFAIDTGLIVTAMTLRH